MAGDHLNVTFVTPDHQVSQGEVDMVVAPSALGELGILPHHRTLLADLVPGVVELRSEDGSKIERFAVSGGFLEVDRNHVALLVESAERPEEIDVERAKRALASAEAALAQLSPLDPAYRDQVAHARRAQVRLEVAKRAK
jgi:F-type H+-transporting ATPase subunit epsilon